MEIISASRRTDIPAFYGDWFMNRIREGRAQYRNPFNGATHEVSLAPENVRAIVFWTRNPAPFLKHLPELDERGYRYIFHFTITGLPRPYEKSGLSEKKALPVFKRLSGLVGPERVTWRYDPIVISEKTSPGYHLEKFSFLARELSGFTGRCYFSFVFFYKKVIRNFALLESSELTPKDISTEEKQSLSRSLAGIAGERGITLYSCCNHALLCESVEKGHCVDGPLLARLFPEKGLEEKLNPTRKDCGCTLSRDIGAYDSCPFGCVYCYANRGQDLAVKNLRDHDPELPYLLPAPRTA